MHHHHFTTNILNTILLYINPTNIGKFFCIHKLDFAINFTYNGINEGLTIYAANTIFNMFPRIKLIGIHLIELINNLCDLNINVINLRLIKLTGCCIPKCYEDIYRNNGEIKMKYISLKIFKHCSKLTYLAIINIQLINTNDLMIYQNLQHVCINNDSPLSERIDLLGLTTCVNLKQLEIRNASTRYIDRFVNLKILLLADLNIDITFFHQLTKLTKLRTLHLINYDYRSSNHDTYEICGLKKLCNVTAISPNICNDFMTMLVKCVKLRKVKCCGNIRNYTKLNECCKLEYLDISECNKIIHMKKFVSIHINILEKHKNLKTLIIGDHMRINRENASFDIIEVKINDTIWNINKKSSKFYDYVTSPNLSTHS